VLAGSAPPCDAQRADSDSAAIAPAPSSRDTTLPAPAPPSPPRPPAPLFTWSDAATGGAFVLVALSIAPSDVAIAQATQGPEHQSDNATTAANVLTALGGWVPIAAGLGLYASGRLSHKSRVAEVGLRTTEAIALGSALTFLVKGLTGRARPKTVGDSVSTDFSFGRGFTDSHYDALPSGHATVAFATATVLTMETARWHPNALWYVAPLAYGGAAAVGWSRIYLNEHWISDVALGAGVGTLAGIFVMRFHQARPHNAIDRWLLPTTLGPSAHGGSTLIWTIPMGGGPPDGE